MGDKHDVHYVSVLPPELAENICHISYGDDGKVIIQRSAALSSNKPLLAA